MTAPALKLQTFDSLAIWKVKRFRGKHLVEEYLDVTTGEIFPVATIKDLGMKSIRPDAQMRREVKLNKLRHEVRMFATFLLKFRNSLGSFLMPLADLVRWYGCLEGKEPKHIRRYLTRLVEAEVLDFDHRLNADFIMFASESGRSMTKGERFTAYRIYDELRLRRGMHLPVWRNRADPDRLAA